MSHSYSLEEGSDLFREFRPDGWNPDEQELIARARREFAYAGHLIEDPIAITYSGDGRCWTAHRQIWMMCTRCDEIVSVGDGNAAAAKYPESELVPIGIIEWKPDGGDLVPCLRGALCTCGKKGILKCELCYGPTCEPVDHFWRVEKKPVICCACLDGAAT